MIGRPEGGPEQPDPTIAAPTWDPQDVPPEVVVALAPPPDVPLPDELPEDDTPSGP